ncbi:peptidase S1 [bacterium]|nr:peptidase S1 [bacterium]
MSTLACFGAAVALVWFGAGPVQSQNPSLKANFGAVRLSSGFTPDPYKVAVVSGGATRTDLGGVRTWVSNAPDFKLTYDAGSLPLVIRVDAPGDTTLLVNTPDGRWVADDDSGGSLNPKVVFNNPQSGRYDIWVGTVTKKNEKGTLVISEVR